MKRCWLLVVVAACEPPAFDASSHVDSVRILAASADRPHAAPGDTVNMSLLAVDGRAVGAQPMRVHWLPGACLNPPNDAYYACFPAFARAFSPGSDLSPLLEEGTSFSLRMPEDAIVAHENTRGLEPYGLAVVFSMACAGSVQHLPQPSAAGPDAVPFGCFDGSGRRLGADDFVFAYSLVYSFANPSNSNPVIDHATVDGAAVDPTDGIRVARCTQRKLEDCPVTHLDLVLSPASQELDPNNRDGDGRVLREQIYVKYYLSAGKAKSDTVVLFDSRKGRLSGTDHGFHAPQTAGTHRLWAVVHDSRGGVAWLELPLHAN